LTSYLADGGLPETVVKDLDRRQYCATLLDSVLYRDIVMRASIRGQRGLGELTRYLLSNVAREYSLRRLTDVAGVRGVLTVGRYLGLLGEAFLVFSLPRFSFKVREQARANRKIFCIDNGLVSAGAFLSGPEWGRLCENLVAVALWRLQLDRRAEILFWRSPQHEEVDFVVKKGPRPVQLLQVCWDLGSAGTKEREVRALLKAGRELRCRDLRVLTADVEGEEPAEWYGLKARVRFVPVWKWLQAGPRELEAHAD
jgi:predicted AAA+ superfamily ATPase